LPRSLATNCFPVTMGEPMAHTKSADSTAVLAPSSQRERELVNCALFSGLICRSMKHCTLVKPPEAALRVSIELSARRGITVG
jgi:hypothetical protein